MTGLNAAGNDAGHKRREAPPAPGLGRTQWRPRPTAAARGYRSGPSAHVLTRDAQERKKPAPMVRWLLRLPEKFLEDRETFSSLFRP